MSEPVRLDPERLLAQTAWVRRLALSLSRDEASADDLAQDALAAALRRPPRDAGNEGALRAWFAAVTRNLAIHRARGDKRRERREHEVARPELERSQERLRELEELRGELVSHVLALSEASQQVVLLHFFEELDSADIARKLGVPDSTIRNRLRRALAELRERIERKHGADWRNLCLFALPSTGAKVAAGAGAVTAAAGGLWLAGGGAGLLLVVLLFAWKREPDARLEASEPVAPPALAQGLDANAQPHAVVERGATDSGRAPAPLAANTKPFLFYGRVLGADKQPLASASVELTDDRNQHFESRGSPEGWYSFAALAPGVYEARIEAEGGAPLATELDLSQAAGDTRRDFTLDSVRYVQVRLLRSDGSLWPQKELAFEYEREFELCVVATAEAPGKQLGDPTWGDYSRYGKGCYRSASRNGYGGIPHLQSGSSGVLDVYGAQPVYASLCQGARVLDSKLLDAGTSSVDFLLDENFVASLGASATAVVIDERSGAPAPGIEVKLGPLWTSAGSAKSDARGVVEFQKLPTGTLELAPDGVWGGVWRTVTIEPGKQHDLGTLPWLPARELHARVFDSAGQPAAADIHLTLQDAGLSPAWRAQRMSAQSDSSGAFSWQHGPGFAVTICAVRKGPKPEAGVALLPRGEGQSVEIHMLPARLVGLRVKGRTNAGRDLRITDAQGSNWGDAWGSLILPDGEYRFELLENGVKLREWTERIDADTRRIELE